MRVSDFDYNLPDELIAQTPLEKRDESRLMVLNRKEQTIEHKTFKNIKYNGQNIGLSEDIYTLKPAKNNNFKYPYQIEEFNQPENVIEELKEIINKIKKSI